MGTNRKAQDNYSSGTERGGLARQKTTAVIAYSSQTREKNTTALLPTSAHIKWGA